LLYALRDARGHIVSLHRDAQPASEVLAPDHPDVLRFLGQAPEQVQFASLDASLVRVVEDLIDALIRRNVLNITDLPAEAQAKLFDRKHVREGMQSHALSLFGAQQAGDANDQVLQSDWSALKD